VSDEFGSPGKHLARRWMGRCRPILNPLISGVTVGLATAFVVWNEPPNPGTDLLWIANGVLLSYLLLSPRRSWPVYLVAGLIAQIVGSSLVTAQWGSDSLAAALNVIEVAVGAALLKKQDRDLPDFTQPRYQLRFVLAAVFAGPVVAGLLYGIYCSVWMHDALLSNWATWVAADGLGTAVTAPACVAVFRNGLKVPWRVSRPWLYPALLIVCTIIAFHQSSWPAAALIYPALVLLLLAMGMAWASLGALFLTCAGTYLVLKRPMVLRPDALLNQAPAVWVQILVVSAMFTLYSISIVIERQRATEKSLNQIAALHALVTENSRDMIILADLDGHRRYVSGAAEVMTGWTVKELMRYESVEMVHPDDQVAVRAAIARLRTGAEVERIEYRIQRRQEGYLWVEASLRLIRHPVTGRPSGILNMARDISQRKSNEKELREAYRALEALAVTDPLTHVSNRRKLDQMLSQEWRRAQRENQTLSLLLVDVDFFKAYNDSFGHLGGDSCLEQIAEVILDVVTRPGDLVARFGGEEFAVLLPNTTREGAVQIAGKINEGLRARQLVHPGSPTGYLTVSIGSATMVTVMGQPNIVLVQRADEALYAAKRAGRNRTCTSEEARASAALSQVS
jgi:diguanylate cyclase (GGDEF)-like protein/PAS domain S-box-containing protein